MTAATVPGSTARVPLSPPVHRKSKVGFGDLFAVTARQHRVAIGATVLLYVLFGLVVVFTKGRATIGDWAFDPKDFTAALAGVVAVFWGAPLLATEYEQQTHLLAWSQDVSAMRWLVAKLTLLGGIVVVLSGVLSLVVNTQAAAEYSRSPSPYSPLAVFGSVGYEAWLPLSLAYAVSGFLFGVAVGALCRRTVTAMGITLAGFAVIRFVVAFELRPWLLVHLIAPVRQIWPMSSYGRPDPSLPAGPGPKDYQFDLQLWLTSSGKSVDVPQACYNASDKAFVNCMTSHGVVASGTDYQPFSRLVIFQSFEMGIFVVLAAVCLGVAVWSVRRQRRI
ncbi:MAG TPA: hypothetical protein VHZ97_21025 [Pseudonocardiaceae bacterium]|jgi:hypothetical protein|nr:hypothetical protein [Pseudonocardiaceae bacterium]